MSQQVQSSNVVRVGADGQLEDRRFGESLLNRALRRLRHDYLTLTMMGILLTIIILSLLAPVISNVYGVDPNLTNPSIRLLPPGSEGHPLGTDNLGRDYLSRLLYGGQISLAVGALAATMALAIGIVFGLVTGFFGGVVDDIMNWAIITLDSIPGLFLLILLGAILSPSPEVLIIVIAFTGWTGTTRLVRGQSIAIRNLDYVTSARAMGATPWRIMFNHIFPNVISVLIISLSRAVGSVILIESTLSFLGFGIQPPLATWGNMLTDAPRFFRDGAHMAIISGLAIFITVLCLYVMGDGIRDAFDPTLND